MNRYTPSNVSILERVSSDAQSYIVQVYGWMTCGLLLTAFVSWYASQTPAILNLIFSSKVIFFGLIIAQVALVFLISGIVNSLSAAMATSLFMLYSALTGLTLSSIFIVYTYSSIASTFMITAGMFGAMSFYGYTTKRDLSSAGSLLFMALIGIFLASLMNIVLNSSLIMFVITYVGVAVFIGLVAYDTQKLKTMGKQLNFNCQKTFRKEAIFGALTLYLDFINLFLMFLRIFSSRR